LFAVSRSFLGVFVICVFLTLSHRR
jgi:hypothetical protein